MSEQELNKKLDIIEKQLKEIKQMITEINGIVVANYSNQTKGAFGW